MHEKMEPMRSDRARWIAAQIRADINGYLWREAWRELKPRFQEDDTWVADYERAREFFNYGYTFRTWSDWLDEVLPEEGHILHVGGGTGMHSGVLAHRQPSRRLVIAENPWGEAVGLPRLRAIFTDQPESTPIFLNRTFGGVNLRPDFYTGIFTTHSYFSMSAQAQAGFFEKVSPALKRGGKLVMIEPVQGREHRRGEWLLRQVAEGAEAGAPHDEFDVAFYSFLFYGALGRAMSGTRPPEIQFANSAAMMDRARAAGLKIVKSQESHDGISVQYVFEKQ